MCRNNNVIPDSKCKEKLNTDPRQEEKVDITDNDVVIVCAKYKRDVSFLNKIPYKHVIIEKYRDVPNVGNEASSYLKYIIDHYENLPEIMIFIHDENESRHHDGELTELLPKLVQKYIYEEENKYYEFNNISFTTLDNIRLNIAERVTHFWRDNFQKPLGFGSINETLPMSRKCCAQFLVTKERVLCRSKEYYKNYYDWIINKATTEGKKHTMNPFNFFSGNAIGVYCEWTWYGLFNGENCQKE
jgi:hypothetical protein